MTTYLLKPGELTLKGGNRESFERILKRNLLALLRGSGVSVETANGRFFVHAPEEARSRTEDALDHLLGIAGWAKSRVCGKTPAAVLEACIAEGQALFEAGIRTFKIEARRTDKSFPLDSYGIRREAGAAVLEAVPGLAVDVHKPQRIIDVEIREKAYIYSAAGSSPEGPGGRGRRGLPVGSAGRGLLLLSGGIDSPAAGYLMASRGMKIDAVYFHAYPYTSDEARRKVVSLAGIIGHYALGIRLYIINFTPVQMRIRERAPLEWTTVLLRMAMMDCAERLARSRHDKCLISGESLSQVASQTIENIGCTESRVTLPVLRPLIGIDKEGIIKIAVSIGTYETSILPYQDCCVLFSPLHPILRGSIEEANRLYEKLALEDLIRRALEEAAVEKCGYPEGQAIPGAGSTQSGPGLNVQEGIPPPQWEGRPCQSR
ncbi:MAG: tRNA 4-thiouridine(8) synthase ThiI [Treponema sp.]|jgi:thiamine biosynthesis protein ThiI|nr:tRNA 4-thiouridine(8) synthase ThiI [Treponema sp.]